MKTESPVNIPSFLAGGGEMGMLTRSKDWSKTSLGDPATWSMALRTIIGIMFNSKFPMFVWWGPELICFYNDAYRPGLEKSGKHPTILGKKAEDAWPEIWDTIKPLINTVIDKGEARWSEDQLIPVHQNGTLEDVYWTFSYSPVNGESGRPEGVLVICYETTEKVKILKEIKEREDQLEFTINAANLATWDLNPVTKKIVANERMREWFGLSPTEEIHLDVALNAIVEKDRQKVIDAINAALQPGSNGNYEVEYTIANTKDHTQHTVLAKGKALFGKDNIAYRLSGILENVTEQDNARKKIDEAEEHAMLAVDSAMLGTFEVDIDTDGIICSKRFREIFGLAHPDITHGEFVEVIHPDDRPIRDVAAEEALVKGTIEYEVRIVWPDQTIHWVHLRGKVFYDENKKPLTMLGTVMDITPQKAFLTGYQESNRKFRNIVKQAPVAIVIFRGPEFIVEVSNDAYLEMIDKNEKDFVGRPLFDSLPEVKESVESLLTGVITTGKPFYGTEFPVTLKRYGKQEIAYFNFVYQAMLEENGDISGIIAVATDVTQSVRAKYSLAESEKQFRNMVMQSPIPMTIFRGKDYFIEMANTEMFEKIWRKKESDIIGKRVLDVFPELKDQKYPELLHEVFTTGKIHRENESVAYVQGDDGLKRFYLDFEYAPLYETDGSVYGIMITVNNVTEKVEARQKVEDAEERLRLATEASGLGTWDLDLEAGTIIHSLKLAEIFGHDRLKKLRHAELRSQVHPGDIDAIVKKAFDEAMKTGLYIYEARIIKPDNSIGWINTQGKVYYDDNNKPVRVLGTTKDITEQNKAAEDLKQFKFMADNVSDFIGICTMDGLSLYVNREGMNLVGLDNFEEVAQASLKDFFFTEDREYILSQFIPNVFQKGKGEIEIRFKHFKTGQAIWMIYNVFIVNDSHGNPVGLATVSKNITERKKTEENIRLVSERFRLLADAMPQFIWTGDGSGNLNYFNKAVYDYSGLTYDQIQKDGWIQIVHPLEREENTEQWINSITTGKNFIFEHRFRRHDGEYRWQLSRAVPQRDASGNIQMWVGTSTDIQDQKIFAGALEKEVQERTRELEQKNGELEKMNTELQSFAYLSSHDLQEPLRKIQTFASRIIASEIENLSENGKDYFKRMQDAANRMQTLIEDLLSYSRTNNTERIFKKTNLTEIIAEVMDDFKETLAGKNAIVDADEVCEATVIPFQFRQLIHNLIGNSLKYSLPGRAPQIKLKCEIVKGNMVNAELLSPEKKYYHLHVSDNGIGFDPHYKDRIFEVFQRLHGKDEYSGTGIGLAIVKKIVENHNGIITATGEVNKGATFDIFIPVT